MSFSNDVLIENCALSAVTGVRIEHVMRIRIEHVTRIRMLHVTGIRIQHGMRIRIHVKRIDLVRGDDDPVKEDGGAEVDIILSRSRMPVCRRRRKSH